MVDNFELLLLHGHKGSLEDIVRSGVVQQSVRHSATSVTYTTVLIPGPFFFEFTMNDNDVVDIREITR